MAGQSHVTAQETEILDFHHPYTPYAIQETFMRTVYQVLEGCKVGILESPTGTVGGNLIVCT
jgi:chromosome transmission fidelity protein 1